MRRKAVENYLGICPPELTDLDTANVKVRELVESKSKYSLCASYDLVFVANAEPLRPLCLLE